MLKKFLIVLFFVTPGISSANNNLIESKAFVEKLGKQVVEKVSNVNISDQERYINFKNL